MYTNKQDLVKQVNWALRAREPIGFKAVSDVSAKWKPAGYEVRFDGGSAVIAHFEGRIVAIAWQQMGDVERHLFAKDCDELLHRDVKELGHFDHGYLESLFHLLKECDGDKRILMGQDVQFEDLMEFLGINCGFYYELSHIAPGVYAVSGNFRDAELRAKAFSASPRSTFQRNKSICSVWRVYGVEWREIHYTLHITLYPRRIAKLLNGCAQ